MSVIQNMKNKLKQILSIHINDMAYKIVGDNWIGSIFFQLNILISPETATLSPRVSKLVVFSQRNGPTHFWHHFDTNFAGFIHRVFSFRIQHTYLF